MSDAIDRAQDQHEYWLANALAEHAARSARAQAARTAQVCDDCDEPIAPARQRAVPGVRRCMACQQALEEGRRA